MFEAREHLTNSTFRRIYFLPNGEWTKEDDLTIGQLQNNGRFI